MLGILEQRGVGACFTTPFNDRELGGGLCEETCCVFGKGVFRECGKYDALDSE